MAVAFGFALGVPLGLFDGSSLQQSLAQVSGFAAVAAFGRVGTLPSFVTLSATIVAHHF